jgi:glycosyltransferase involved in cell wall biosynthesis
MLKVLFDHGQPFILAHGGFQTQIEQTKAGLRQIGIDVEYMRWWDAEQAGDLIHFFSTARTQYLQLARRRRLPVIMTQLFSATCNRSNWHLGIQAAVTRSVLGLPLFRNIKDQLTWTAYRACDQLVVGLEAEKTVLVRVFGIDPARISIVPLGLSASYLEAPPSDRRGEHLVSTGTITQQKGSIPLALMARAARVPILFVGKPYDVNDSYWLQFQSMVDDRWIKYHPHVVTEGEMIELLRGARGFVLNSEFENWSLSASEAVACGLPLLLRDQKWSRERFGNQSRYFTAPGRRENVEILRRFYEDCPHLPPPKIKLFSWVEVAERLQNVYRAAAQTSR